MRFGPITSWQIDRETMTGFIFLNSKITADGDCSHEIKRPLLLERKAVTNQKSILKHSVMLDSLQPHHGLYSPWNSPGQKTGVGNLFFLQWMFPIPGIETGSPALQAHSLPTELSGKRIKKQRHYFANKVHKVKASHVWM